MKNDLTIKILLYMVAGIVLGFLLKFLMLVNVNVATFINNVVVLGGNIFISLLQLLVIPIVFVSIICGICSLENTKAVSEIGLKSFKWFIITTVLAALLAITIIAIFNLILDLHLAANTKLNSVSSVTPSLWQLIGNIVPSNPFKAMFEANILQIIVFAILFGLAVNIAGESGRRVATFFCDLNVICMKFIAKLMEFAPYGVFCLVATVVAAQGFNLVINIVGYFFAVLIVLAIHTTFTLSVILHFCNISPMVFFRKMYTVMLFAFGTSSSNATIPIALDAVENKLGVSKAVSSFVIPFGVNINKNGTAIMQCVATLFIANIYDIQITFVGYLILLFMVVLVSIGTAGLPGVGMITLVMILKQLGLPLEGISLIIGVDRLLDMARTVVNVISNAVVACLVAVDQNQLDYKIYYNTNAKQN